jgi:hypothetical protein
VLKDGKIKRSGKYSIIARRSSLAARPLVGAVVKEKKKKERNGM